MKIQKAVVNNVAQILKKKAIVPLYERILFTEGKIGAINTTGIAIVANCPEINFQCMVKGAEFNQFLITCKDAVELSDVGATTITCVSGRRKAKFNTEPFENPELLNVPAAIADKSLTFIQEINKDFIEKLKICVELSAIETSPNEIYNGVLLHTRGNLFALNSIFILQVMFGDFELHNNSLYFLPIDFCKYVIKLYADLVVEDDDTAIIFIKDDKICVTFSGVTISVMQLDVTCFNPKSWLEKIMGYLTIFDKSDSYCDLTKEIKEAVHSSSKISSLTKLNLDENLCIVNTKSEIFNITDVIPQKTDFFVRAQYNSKYLNKVIQLMEQFSLLPDGTFLGKNREMLRAILIGLK